MMRRVGRWGPSPGGLVTTLALVIALVVRPSSPETATGLLAAPAAPTETTMPLAALEVTEVPLLRQPASTPTPEPKVVVSISLPEGDDTTREAIERWMASLWPGYVPRFTASDDEAIDVALGHEPPGDDVEGFLLAAMPWVAATHFTSDVEDLALEGLRAAFKGERSSWAELDGPNVPIAPVLVAPSRAVGAAALGLRPDELGEVDVTSPADFADRAADLARQPGLLLLLPLPLADMRFHPLMVDGASPLLQRGPVAEYRLKGERWLGIRWGAFDGPRGADFRSGLIRFLADEATPPVPDVTTLTAVGDIIFGRKVDQRLVAYGDYTRPFHLVGDELRRADLTVANLECTLTDLVRPPHDWGTFSFGSSPKAIEGLRFGGIDVVSLANNHSRDMGPQAFLQMLDVLTEAEIQYAGAGRDLAEAHTPAIVEVRGTRYAFLGYDEIGSYFYRATERTPGTAAMSEEAVRRDVAAARQQADVVIPFFHWGVEYTNHPTERQRRVARAAVEAGAAMVLGSHPHWVQAVEFYEGAFIAYSLGNFIFDQSWSTETMQGVIMHTSFVDGRLASIRFLPIQIEDLHQPRILDRRPGRPILDRMFSVSDL